MNYRMKEPIFSDSRELKFHYSDPSRPAPEGVPAQATNMLDLMQSTSILSVMLTWGKTWRSPSQTIICQPTLGKVPKLKLLNVN